MQGEPEFDGPSFSDYWPQESDKPAKRVFTVRMDEKLYLDMKLLADINEEYISVFIRKAVEDRVRSLTPSQEEVSQMVKEITDNASRRLAALARLRGKNAKCQLR